MNACLMQFIGSCGDNGSRWVSRQQNSDEGATTMKVALAIFRTQQNLGVNYSAGDFWK